MWQLRTYFLNYLVILFSMIFAFIVLQLVHQCSALFYIVVLSILYNVYFYYVYILSNLILGPVSSDYAVFIHERIIIVRYRGGVTSKAFGLAISRSQVQILLGSTLRHNLRQVVYTYVPLSPSSITWYRPKGGDALRLGR